MSDIDDLLDGTLDDLADLPEFKPFAPGVHRVIASMELKKINDAQAVELSFKMIEVQELVDPQDEEEGRKPVEGDTANTMFMMNNEFGVGNFKRCAKSLAEGLNMVGATNREIIEAVTDVECLIITSIRADKKDPDRLYLNVKEIAVV